MRIHESKIQNLKSKILLLAIGLSFTARVATAQTLEQSGQDFHLRRCGLVPRERGNDLEQVSNFLRLVSCPGDRGQRLEKCLPGALILLGPDQGLS